MRTASNLASYGRGISPCHAHNRTFARLAYAAKRHFGPEGSSDGRVRLDLRDTVVQVDDIVGLGHGDVREIP